MIFFSDWFARCQVARARVLHVASFFAKHLLYQKQAFRLVT